MGAFRIVVPLLGAPTLAACTTILGDDFEFSPEGAGAPRDTSEGSRPRVGWLTYLSCHYGRPRDLPDEASVRLVDTHGYLVRAFDGLEDLDAPPVYERIEAVR